MKIRRTADGAIFEGPDGPIPAGYTRVLGIGVAEGPLARSATQPNQPGFLGRLKANLPNLAKSPQVQLAAGLLMPWSRVPGLAGTAIRAAQGGMLSGGLKALETGNLGQAVQSGGLGALFQGVGEKTFDLGRYFLSAIPHRMFAHKTAGALLEWLTTHIPSWRDVATGKPAQERLVEWAHGLGEQVLSDKIYKEAIPLLTKNLPKGLTVPVDHEAAVALGVPLPTSIAQPPLGGPGLSIPLSVQEVINGLPKLRALGGPVYHRTLRQLMGALESVPTPDLQETAAARLSALRREYKEGSGFIEFSRKSRMFAGNVYSPEAAQKGLLTHYPDVVRSRQMGEGLWNIIKGGPELRTAPNILPSKTHPWGGAIMGGAAGGVLGLGAGGVHGLGLGGGAGSAIGYGLGMAPRYRNVPMAPATSLLRNVGAFGLGQAAQEQLE